MPRKPAVPAARRAALRRRLLAWWDAGHRDLPWRFPQHGADPYRVWLAEVMLQQTRVQAVVPYYLRFLARWPTLEALAAAADAEVLAAWSGLGYYARCRNLLSAAREALRRHGGLPADPEALRALPGFGPYTTGAVASIAFARPEPAVDGNVLRVLARIFRVPGRSQSPKVNKGVAARAAELVDPGRPGDWNQALMELGATVCAPRRPRCARCPLASLCQAHAAGREEGYPRRRRRRPGQPVVRMALARVERAGRLLLACAPEGGLLPGLWGLPCVVVPEGEGHGAALAAGLRSGAGLRLEVGEEVGALVRVLTHRRLEMRVLACRLVGRNAPESGRMRFTTAEEASRLPASTAMRRAIEVSGGWPSGPRTPRARKILVAESRKPLTSSGSTV
jgi:A/G-specific adenine glycosylase